MTWKPEPTEKQDEQSSEGLVTEAIIAVNVSPDKTAGLDIAIAD